MQIMMDAPASHEADLQSLKIEVKYAPEALYSRLTADNLPHSFELGNNLQEIRRHNLDPILTLETKVMSDFRGGPGSRLEAAFKADMDFRTQINGLKPADFAPYFKRVGLRLEYKEVENPNEGDVKQPYYVSAEGSKNPVKIRLFDVSYGTYTILVNSPSMDAILIDPKEFADGQKAFFVTIQKIIGAIYDMEGKTLPTRALVFKERTQNTAFSVQCTYCGDIYGSSESFECPGCGSSSPMTEGGKVKYFN